MNTVPDATPIPATPQRDAHGRFVKGNAGGPGNPFARHCAALRKAAAELVTAQDAVEVMAAMLRKAKEGDVLAAKFVFSYAIGRPLDPPDPDRLDVDEWQVLQDHVLTPEEANRPLQGVPLDYAGKFVPMAVQVRSQALAGQFLDNAAQREEAERQNAQAAGPVPVESVPPPPRGANGSACPRPPVPSQGAMAPDTDLDNPELSDPFGGDEALAARYHEDLAVLRRLADHQAPPMTNGRNGQQHG